jgi:hypothetical protein
MIYVAAALSLPAWGQKIETEKPDRNQIVHVQTALNHLTVIEVGEPVITVAAGSPSFKIEWRDNKVFVQPTEPGTSTNLFIWTASGRLNYELEPAGTVGQMDFALDQSPAPMASKPVAQAKPLSPPGPTEVLKDLSLIGSPIWVDGLKESKNRVIVLLEDVYHRDDKVFIRYAIRNRSKNPYSLSTPQVWEFDVPRPLYGLSNTQLTANEMSHLKSTGHSQVQVVEADASSPTVKPGEVSVGVVGVKLPATRGRTVLHFVFPEYGSGQPTATLVL